MQQFAIVQSEYRLKRPPRPIYQKLKPERVQEELKTMPAWSLHSSGKAIQRLYQFTSERAAANYAAYLSACAGDARQPVHLTVAGKSLTVKLFAPTRNGRSTALDMGVLAFARQLN
jgi:pterin-4a-carbinolamine dehydratase